MPPSPSFSITVYSPKTSLAGCPVVSASAWKGVSLRWRTSSAASDGPSTGGRSAGRLPRNATTSSGVISPLALRLSLSRSTEIATRLLLQESEIRNQGSGIRAQEPEIVTSGGWIGQVIRTEETVSYYVRWQWRRLVAS